MKKVKPKKNGSAFNEILNKNHYLFEINQAMKKYMLVNFEEIK